MEMLMQLQNKKIVLYSLTVILGAGIYFIENIFKFPVPFFRLGLSHVITLFLIYNGIEFKDICIIMFLKIVIGTMMSGTFLSVVFYLSLVSNIISLIIQFTFYKFLNKIFSIYSVSVIGALSNSFIQLLFIYFFIVNNLMIIYLYRYIFWFSLFTGLLNAFLTMKLASSCSIKSLF